MEITYGIHSSPFGWCLLGIRGGKICNLSFLEKKSRSHALALLKEKWPQVTYLYSESKTKPYLKKVFGGKKSEKPALLIEGTDFQKKVWEELLKIPRGKTKTYNDIAKGIKAPKAVRAVGTACGKNSIAFAIPCHRVIASDGSLGGYRWGLKRKQAILAWEQK